MRSYLQRPSGPSARAFLCRGRHSKVLNHVINVHVAETSLRWLSELQPLANKTASTIASALILNVQEVVLHCVLEGEGSRNDCVRCIHLLTGDAIATNEAAARRVLPHMTAFASRHGVSYFLLVWICASHQSNLAVMVAICGGRVKDAVENDPICANCSRLFRHLMADYSEEFAQSLWRHVESVLRLIPDDEDIWNDAPARHALQLQALYGKAVLPDDLLGVLNFGFGILRHICARGTSREDVSRQVYALLYKYIIIVEDKPITSRFWTFASCVNALLRFHLLGLPDSIFSVSTVQPRKDNQKRLKSFKTFYNSPEHVQKLRVACLSLQLTGYATSLTAQKTTLENGREPALVRLGKGEVQLKTCAHLSSLVQKLNTDPNLDIGRALWSLMVTEATLLIRFSWYSDYPTKLWEICKMYNIGYLIAIEAFLWLPAERLDVGYGIQLQAKALGQGSHALACAYLQTECVQAEIIGILQKGEGTSLDVEREHQVAKHATEGVAVKGAAACSRNTILQTCHVERSLHMQQHVADETTIRKLLHANARQLAVHEKPHLFSRGRGQLHWESGVTEADRRQLTHVGDEQALQAYIGDNYERLDKQAKAMVQKGQAMQKAKKASPHSNRQWLTWLEDNHAYFADLLKTASPQRRQLGRRIVQLSDSMPAVPQWQPQLEKCLHERLVDKLVSAGPGFYVFEAACSERVAFFVAHIRRKVWGWPLSHTTKMRFSLDVGTMHTNFQPLYDHFQELGLDGMASDIVVLRLVMSFDCLRGCVATWLLEEAHEVEVPVRKERAAAAADETSADEDDVASGCERSDVASIDSDADSSLPDETAEQLPAEATGGATSDEGEGLPDSVGGHPSRGGLVFNNNYFTLRNDPGYPNAKMLINDRFCVLAELGISKMSKTLVIKHYDALNTQPVRTYLALRAWMLMRATQDGWVNRKPPRQKWHVLEAERLRQDVIALRILGGGTGNAKADAHIRSWWPDALS